MSDSALGGSPTFFSPQDSLFLLSLDASGTFSGFCPTNLPSIHHFSRFLALSALSEGFLKCVCLVLYVLQTSWGSFHDVWFTPQLLFPLHNPYAWTLFFVTFPDAIVFHRRFVFHILFEIFGTPRGDLATSSRHVRIFNLGLLGHSLGCCSLTAFSNFSLYFRVSPSQLLERAFSIKAPIRLFQFTLPFRVGKSPLDHSLWWWNTRGTPRLLLYRSSPSSFTVNFSKWRLF